MRGRSQEQAFILFLNEGEERSLSLSLSSLSLILSLSLSLSLSLTLSLSLSLSLSLTTTIFVSLFSQSDSLSETVSLPELALGHTMEPSKSFSGVFSPSGPTLRPLYSRLGAGVQGECVLKPSCQTKRKKLERILPIFSFKM